MKQNLNRLSQRYLAALRTHLRSEARDGLQPALRLGRQAARLRPEDAGVGADSRRAH